MIDCGCDGEKLAIAERAAVLEHDGGMTREAADAAARREFAGRCWGCGQPQERNG